MKKAFILLAVVAFAAACSNKTANTTTTSADGKTVYYTTSAAAVADAKNAKYQIIDQEFDNMLAPDSDYDSLSDYELQACGASYLPPAEKLKKPQVKAAAATAVKADAAKTATKTSVSKSKKVTNTTNIYYVDGPTPNVPTKSTSTTTTYASDGTVISTTTK